MILAALLGTACDVAGGAESHAVGEAPRPAARPPLDRPASPPGRSSVAPAMRCGECHEKIFDEWRGSGHARADSSPAYAAMRVEAGAACDRCHAPLRVAGEEEQVAREGVSCEVCHRIKAVELRAPGSAEAGPALELLDNRKYGPLCDADDHYFHKMGCSPLHVESRFCAACHDWSVRAPSGEIIPVFTEYAEWRALAGAMDCSDCHMPGEAGEAATGARPRGSVPHHGWLGRAGDLRRAALTLRVSATGDAERVRASVTVANRRAGHHVPTGLPGKQLIVRARVLDRAGAELARQERVYARVLVDQHGAEVPFYRAARVGSDSRLAAHEERHEEFELEASGAGLLRVELVWRSASPALLAAVKLPPAAEIVLLAAEAPFGPPRRSSGRAGLPRTFNAAVKR